MAWNDRNRSHVFIEGVVQDISLLPDNDSNYVLHVSIDELRLILTRRLWDLMREFPSAGQTAIDT